MIIAMEGRSMIDCLNLVHIRRFLFGSLVGSLILIGVTLNSGCKNITNRAQSPDQTLPTGKDGSDTKEQPQKYICLLYTSDAADE